MTSKIAETDNGRKIFYIDIVNMPTEKVMEYLERVKERIAGKRISKN